MISFINQNSGVFLVIFSFIVTAATVAYAILTAKLVSETRKMREAQTEPNILASLHSKEDYVGLMDLEIKNIGLGAAYNLRFQLKPDFEYSKGQFLSKVNFINNGVNYLAPNQKISHFLTSIIGRPELEKTTIKLGVKYENCLGKGYQQDYVLDFSEFWGRRYVGESHIKNIAQNLEKIAKDLHQIYSGMQKLKVIAYTKQDIEEEIKAQNELIQQTQKQYEK
jgi:hypothetical protein